MEPADEHSPGAPPDPCEPARLRWRCRRGMRELDVVLTRYLERVWASASARERRAFAQLLDLQDPELFGYLVGRATPAEECQREVIACIRRLGP